MNPDLPPLSSVDDDALEMPVELPPDSVRLPPWLQGQLARLYSSVMEEALPPELLVLAQKLDEQAANPDQDGADD